MNSRSESGFSAIYFPRQARKKNCGKYSSLKISDHSRLPGVALSAVEWAKTGVSRLSRRSFLAKGEAILFIFLLALPVFAQSPAWWYSRGAVDTNLQANDYAYITLGQLKWIATNACAEMNAYFGAGSNVTAVVSAFSSSNNYYYANLGQVKYVVQPFYDRLYALNLTKTFPAYMPGYYPWGSSQSTNDYAFANIGQVKFVFSFDSAKDTDGDGLADWHEAELGTDPYDPDSDGDGLSDGWEVEHGTDPLDPDSDGDGLYDGWEVAHGYDPLNSNDGNETIVREVARQKIVRNYQLYYATTPVFTNTPGSTADLNDMKNALNALSGKFYKKN